MANMFAGSRSDDKWDAFETGACLGLAAGMAIVGVYGPASTGIKILRTAGALGPFTCSFIF